MVPQSQEQYGQWLRASTAPQHQLSMKKYGGSPSSPLQGSPIQEQSQEEGAQQGGRGKSQPPPEVEVTWQEPPGIVQQSTPLSNEDNSSPFEWVCRLPHGSEATQNMGNQKVYNSAFLSIHGTAGHKSVHKSQKLPFSMKSSCRLVEQSQKVKAKSPKQSTPMKGRVKSPRGQSNKKSPSTWKRIPHQ